MHLQTWRAGTSSHSRELEEEDVVDLPKKIHYIFNLDAARPVGTPGVGVGSLEGVTSLLGHYSFGT